MSAFQSCLFSPITEELISDVIHQQESELTDEQTTDVHAANYEERLASEVVKLKIHVLEALLEKGRSDRNAARAILPEETHHLYDQLAPVYAFMFEEPNLDSIQDFLKFCKDVTENSSDQEFSVYFDTLCSLKEKLQFVVWCINHIYIGPSWTAKRFLETCIELPRLNALKALGGLQISNKEEIHALMSNDSKSFNVFRSYFAIIEFVSYLYSCFPIMKASGCLKEVENLIGEIEPLSLRLQILEDLFALCFLRREDICFEESASEGGESEEIVQTKKNSKSKCSSEHYVSHSNSPNSQTGTSSTILAEKNGISLGFLCQRIDKLQDAMEMLGRRLESLDCNEAGELSLRHGTLNRFIQEALWRLRLLESTDSSTCNEQHFCRNFSRGHGQVSVRKAWIARLPATIQTGFNYVPTRRKVRVKPAANLSVSTDHRLMNRLLSDPISLLVMTMMSGNLTCARQVCDLHQLWKSLEGKQLQYSLTHKSATQELQRMVSSRQESKEDIRIFDQTPDSIQSIIIQGLNSVAISSAVETLLSRLVQTFPTQEDLEDQHIALVLVDLVICTACELLPDDRLELLDLAWRRCQRMTIDVSIEPWKSLERLVELAQEFSRTSDCAFEIKSPLRTFLSLDPKLLRKHSQLIRQIGQFYNKLNLSLASEDWNQLEADFHLVADHLSNFPIAVPHASNLLPSLHSYLAILRQLVSDKQLSVTPSLLISQDITTLVMERLRENVEQVQFLEGPTAQLGIQLPCFIATCLRTKFDQSSSPHADVSSADISLIRNLVGYLNDKCPLLAQTLDIYLQVQLAVELNLSLNSDETCAHLDVDIFRRFLKHQKKGNRVGPVVLARTKSKRSSLSSLREQISEATHIPSVTTQSTEDGQLGRVILEKVAPCLVSQLQHLVSQPLSMVEQMLMNGQIAAAADVIKLVRQHSSNCDVDELEIKNLLLRYASKALVLALPDVQQSTRPENGVQPKKKSSSFTLPATVPPKELWVADADVSQCPCCMSVRFSMFNRRHHCRRCGRVVCAGCSPHRQLVEGYGDVPMRTCSDCFMAMSGNTSGVRTARHDGKTLWMLSLDAHHNEIVRREFSYEHAPNLALALAIVQLCHEKDEIAHYLLNQSSAMLSALHRYLLGGALFEVDPTMILQLIKSLILTAKMRYSEIGIVTPTKGKPTRGLARCDALLGQIDLLSLLASANCLHLLPSQPLSQLDTWRKLRDRLIEIELWSLALDISTKAGIDPAAVWAAWGLVCLKAGNFQGARQRFQRCLKPNKSSPLLQEIVTVLESLSLPFQVCSSGNANSTATMAKRNRRFSASGTQMVSSDKPELIISSLSALRDICSGNFVVGDKDSTLDEILFYLNTYGTGHSPYNYLVDKKRIDTAVHQFFSNIHSLSVDIFNQGLLLPCLRAGKLDDLIFEMKRHDASLQTWKLYLLSGAHLLETKCYWNSLYQLYCLSSDHLRACLIAIRRLYLSDLFSIEAFIARSELLEEILAHLKNYLFSPPPEPKEKERQSMMPLWRPLQEVSSLQKSVQLQLDVTEFIDQCFREGRISPALMSVLKSITQGSQDNTAADLHHHIPSLLGSRADRCACSVFVTVSNPTYNGFQLSWKICTEQGVRLDRYFRFSAFILIKQYQVASLILLVEFIKQRMAASMVGFFDVDELLVECATLVQDRDKEQKSQDIELIVQQIKKATIRIQAYINVGWLKAAYLLAVKCGSVSDVINIQREAVRLQQSAVLTLCNRWLAARSTKS